MSAFVDMALTDKERAQDMPAVGTPFVGPIYPYGLCLSFTQEELEKLDLCDDCEPGDMIQLSCLAKVTSMSKNDTTDGVRKRVEMQITHIAAEGEEPEKPKEEPTARLGKRYKAE